MRKKKEKITGEEAIFVTQLGERRKIILEKPIPILLQFLLKGEKIIYKGETYGAASLTKYATEKIMAGESISI